MVSSSRSLNVPLWLRAPKSMLLWAVVLLIAQSAHGRSLGAPPKPTGGDGTPYEEPEVVVGTDDSDPKDPPTPFPGSRHGGSTGVPKVGSPALLPAELRIVMLRVAGIFFLDN